KKALTVKGPGGSVDTLAFSPDGGRLAGGSNGGDIVMWDANTGQQIATLQAGPGPAVRALVFAPDGKRLASVRGRAPVAGWARRSARVHRALPGEAPPYRAVAFGPRGDVVAAGSANGTVQVWDSRSGEVLCAIRGHAGMVFGVAVAADGTMVATASNDATVRVWDSLDNRALPQIQLEKQHLQALFRDLKSDSETRASLAMLVLASAAPQSLPALGQMVKQGKPADQKVLMQALGDLRSEKFAVRQKAMQLIAAMGQAARPALRRMVKEKPTDLETLRRAELLLAKLEYEMTVEDIRLTQRAIVVLERVGNSEAR